jgi:ligand-binding sensor domain-containing protein
MLFDPYQEANKPVGRTASITRARKRTSSLVNWLTVFSYLFFITMLAYPLMASASNQTESEYVRKDFTVEDGLPDNVVNAIAQAGNGLLWVGTESGLASFEGREFTPIDLRIPGSPAQGAVNALVEASNGDLWVGTNAGLVQIPSRVLDQLDPAQLMYYRLGTEGTSKVESLYQTRDGVLWVGTNHGLYRQASGQFVLALPSSFIIRIAEAPNGGKTNAM